MTKRKVLFIILPYLVESPESKAGCWGNKYPEKEDGCSTPSTRIRSWAALPYGALSVMSYNKDLADFKLVDCNVEENYITTIHDILQTFKPEVVAFNMTFDNCYPHLKGLLAMVTHLYRPLIVIGGAATIPVYKEILDDNPEIDAVCFHDGELPFRWMLEHASTYAFPFPWRVKMGENIASPWITRGLLEEGIPPSKLVVDDLDDIIAIDYRFVDIEKYKMAEEFSPYADDLKSQRRFFVVTSRGCPYKCGFCYRSRDNDKRMRFAGVNKVIEHVEDLINRYGMNVLTICDDQFLVNKHRAKEILRRLAAYNLRVELLQGVSVAFIDEEMAGLMARAGVKRVVLPIESGSPEILAKMVSKPVDLDRAKEVIRILKKQGIWTTAVFVMGFPGEKDKHRKETLEWVRASGLDWSTFSAAVPIKGTKLYDICVEGGYIKDDIKLGDMDFTNYFIHTPGYEPEYVAEEIYRMNLICNFVENPAMKAGDNRLAAKAFKQVLKACPDHAFAYYYLHICTNDTAYAIKATKIFSENLKWLKYAKELIWKAN